MWKSDRRLYLTADTKPRVVEEGDPDARYLLVHEGGEMTEDRARELGLLKKSEKAAEKVEDKASEQAANKARRRPRT